MIQRRHLWLAAAALPLLSRPAWAHAQLRSAEPPVGSSGPAPHEVTLIFSEGVEPAFSSIAVTDAAGARADQGEMRRDPADQHRLSVGVKQLLPGRYHVAWKVTSVDTHKTEGTFDFTVVG